jgi:hypothetical protein
MPAIVVILCRNRRGREGVWGEQRRRFLPRVCSGRFDFGSPCRAQPIFFRAIRYDHHAGQLGCYRDGPSATIYRKRHTRGSGRGGGMDARGTGAAHHRLSNHCRSRCRWRRPATRLCQPGLTDRTRVGLVRGNRRTMRRDRLFADRRGNELERYRPSQSPVKPRQA